MESEPPQNSPVNGDSLNHFHGKRLTLIKGASRRLVQLILKGAQRKTCLTQII